jgi:DNA-binding response OmpR family regulator
MQLSPNPILLYLRITEDCDDIARVFQQSSFRIIEFKDLPALTDWHQHTQHAQHTQPRQHVAALATIQHGGLALAEMALLPVVLVDLQPDIKAALYAVRLRAADYILLTTSITELVARATALQQLLSTMARPDITTSRAEGGLGLGTATITLDPQMHAIRKDDMWVSLSPIEWRLFHLLLQKRGRIVSSAELTSSGLHRENYTHVETSLLRLHMSRLRAKLQQHFGDQFNIITLRGQGYMLE